MARKKKVKITEFANTLEDIIAEYADDVSEDMPDIVQDVAESARQAVVQNITTAGIGGTKYKNSIELTIQKGKRLASATIYSPRHYQLTHLLEYGHIVVAHGKVYGKTRAFPHWQQAEQAANEEIEKRIKEAVKK